jgi:hypothetical protein
MTGPASERQHLHWILLYAGQQGFLLPDVYVPSVCSV